MKKICLLGTIDDIHEKEKRLEEIRNDFIQRTQEKRKNEMPYDHLFKNNFVKTRYKRQMT